MRHKIAFMSFGLLALFLALAPSALASNRWYVDGVNGSDTNDCLSSATACKTIGHAISLTSSGDGISVAPATYAENLVIATSLMIIGSRTATTIIDGNQAGTVFTISGATTRVLLSKLTIRNGYAGFSGDGGGVNNSGILTINTSIISGNNATNGGGILNYGTVTINRSTITANSVFGGGGGILNYGTVTVNDSTISANSLQNGGGGGINNQRGATLTVNNSTLSGNSGDAISNYGLVKINNGTISGNSGGIQQNGTSVTLQNSIVANNSGGNCGSTTFPITSNGYNLSSDNTCHFNGPGDMNSTYPKLGMLGNYGGPTQTIPIDIGSPAIDAGNPTGCTDSNGNLLKTDQRGMPRPGRYDTGTCDIGAVERQRD